MQWMHLRHARIEIAMNTYALPLSGRPGRHGRQAGRSAGRVSEADLKDGQPCQRHRRSRAPGKVLVKVEDMNGYEPSALYLR